LTVQSSQPEVRPKLLKCLTVQSSQPEVRPKLLKCMRFFQSLV